MTIDTCDERLALAETLAPVDVLDALMARHGVLRIVLALPGAVLQRRRASVLREDALSAHLRRDIGLRPEAPRKDPWLYR